MRSTIRRSAALAVALTLATAGSLAAATPAHASMNCFGLQVEINTAPGGEPASTATGHAHSTGAHYVHHTFNRNWVYYSDNSSGGVDLPDTYYGTIAC